MPADTTSPTLTSLTFPTIVNLSGGNTPATFSAAATDDSSGIYEVILWFDRNIVTDIGSFQLIGLFGFSDSWADGASSEARTILTANAHGVYNITHVDVHDVAGNVHV